MKILISPAKSLDFQKSLPTERFTEPNFIDEAIQYHENDEALADIAERVEDMMSARRLFVM